MASQPVKSTKYVRSQDTLPSSDGLAGNSLFRFHGSDTAPSSDPPDGPIAAPDKQTRPRSRLIPGVTPSTASSSDRGRSGSPITVSQTPARLLTTADQPSSAPPAVANADRAVPLPPPPSTGASSMGYAARSRLPPSDNPKLSGASRPISSSSYVSQPGARVPADAHKPTGVAPITTLVNKASPAVSRARTDASIVHTARSRLPPAELARRAKLSTPPIQHSSILQVNATAGPSKTTEAFDDGSTYANAVRMPLDPRKRQRQEDAFRNVQPATGDGPFR